MSNFFEICQNLGLTNLKEISIEKRGKMCLVTTESGSMLETKKTSTGEYFLKIKVVDPSTTSHCRISIFSKRFLPNLSFEKGDILHGSFYVSII
jgi:hypothetical protein